MIGILLITHGYIGQALLDAALDTFHVLSTSVTSLRVPNDEDLSILLQRANQCVLQVNQGDGVLVLTDMVGTTASNLANQLLHFHNKLEVVNGVNLPMLFRVLNYAHLSLPQLTQKALTGGNEGIILSHDTKENYYCE